MDVRMRKKQEVEVAFLGVPEPFLSQQEHNFILCSLCSPTDTFLQRREWGGRAAVMSVLRKVSKVRNVVVTVVDSGLPVLAGQ